VLQSLNPLRLLLFSALLAGGLLCLSAAPAAAQSDILVQLRAESNPTMKGTTICGKKEPNCKTVTVIYRFEPVAGKQDAYILFADALNKGKREPLFKLPLYYDPASKTLAGEVRVQSLHGFWEYHVASTGETFNTGNKYRIIVAAQGRSSGHVTVFSGQYNTLVRRIDLKFVDSQSLPAAPQKDQYR